MSKAKLTASEWELVKDAPYWVNQVLAEADGRVSFFTRRREGKALDKAITEYKTKNSLINDIIADDSDAAKEIEKASGADAEKALSRIAAIVEEKLGSDDLAELKDFLLKVGNEIASSSKEGGTGIAKAMSEKEAAALTRLESAMKVSSSYATAHTAQPKPAAKPSSYAKPAAKPSASATPSATPAPAKRDDDDKKKDEQEKKLAEARERQEKAREKAEEKKEEEAKKRLEKAREEAAKRSEKEREEAAKRAEKEREEAAKRAEKEREGAAAAPGYTEFIAEHTVLAGDNLSFISERYYGHQGNFRIIYEANRDIIGDNMNIIRPGQVLKIPKL